MQIKLESTPEREQALFELASTTNFSALSNLLNIGTNPNALSADGTKRTPLHVAAQSGNAGVILFLLEAGADMRIQDALGMTPLHYAVQYNEQATRLLIERGADVDAAGPARITPLHRAAQKGIAGCVQALVEGGANVHAVQSADLSVALHLAADEGHDRACQLLLEAGARANYLDVRDRTPLHRAAEKGHLEACRALVAGGADPDFVTHELHGSSSDRSPLQEAVLHKRVAVVEYFLLTCGADHSLRSRKGETLAILASGDVAISRILRAVGSQALLDDIIGDADDAGVHSSIASPRGLLPL